MARKKDQDLQRYFDGELKPRRAKQVRASFDASDGQRLEALSQMRDLLRQSSEQAAEQADFSKVWSRVRAGIVAERPRTLRERLGLWVQRYRYAFASAVAAAALAGVIFVLHGRGSSPRNDVVIENLDVSPEVVSTIFTIDDDEEAGPTTVLWISDNQTTDTDDDGQGQAPRRDGDEGESSSGKGKRAD